MGETKKDGMPPQPETIPGADSEKEQREKEKQAELIRYLGGILRTPEKDLDEALAEPKKANYHLMKSGFSLDRFYAGGLAGDIAKAANPDYKFFDAIAATAWQLGLQYKLKGEMSREPVFEGQNEEVLNFIEKIKSLL